MKTSLRMATLVAGASMLALMAPVQAQPRSNGPGQATLALPPDVNRVISIDAFNELMVEMKSAPDPSYRIIPTMHIYSGGLARLFGGTSIPTLQFVSPGSFGAANSGVSILGGSQNLGNNNALGALNTNSGLLGAIQTRPGFNQSSR